MGRVKGHIPIRRCIACGTRRSKNELIRLVLDDKGQLMRDDHGKGQVRGAYICKDKLCQEKMQRDKCLDKAFRGRKVTMISPALKCNKNFGGING